MRRRAAAAHVLPLGWLQSKGISKPGEIVWSRVFVEDNMLKADPGRATMVELPAEENARRWAATTPQRPMMNAVLHGFRRCDDGAAQSEVHSGGVRP